MSSTRRAAIDMGTNSIKLLVGDVEEGTVTPVHECAEQTRLGRGLYDSNRIQPEALANTTAVVCGFVLEAKGMGASDIRIFATSAVRDAANGADLTRGIRQHSGVPVRILSGDQEADWIYRGVLTDPRHGDRPLLILDVGGGSTEFIFGAREHPRFARSYQLGTVRSLEGIDPPEPPTPDSLTETRRILRDFLIREVRPDFLPLLDSSEQPEVVATGGTINILARMHLRTDEFIRERIDAALLTLEGLRQTTHNLWSLPLRARQQIPGLPPNRADVMLMGAAIFEAILDTFNLPRVAPCTRGLRFAALLDPPTGHG